LTTDAVANYRDRFCQILEYIDAHLEEDLSVERLSNVAAFSKYHFHRQFSELFGVNVYRYIQLNRLKRAAYQLAFRDRYRVIDIALMSGYERPESFSRAFKQWIGQTPSEFRKQPDWDTWHSQFQPLMTLRIDRMKSAYRLSQVQLVTFPATKVAVLEHHGDPNLLGESIRQFIEWRKQHNRWRSLPERESPQVSATFNIIYNNPAEIPPAEYRCDLCAAIDVDVVDNPFGVVTKTIPGGKCAVLRHIGSDDNIGESIRFLSAEWLPQSGAEPRDFPLYLQRVSFFPDVPEHEAITDIFLPIA
jgi:AraC family transcriptional regulator